jgi:hypothetical protein
MPMPRSSKSRGVIGKRPILNGKRDLVAEVQQLAKSFTTLRLQFKQSQEKYRDGLYKFAAECYSSGRRLINDRVECERFWRQPFWKGVHKAPKRDEVMKAVMMVAMDTNSRPYLRKRAEKTGKVLQSFSEDEVEPDEVVERLKEGGGIEKMYRERAEPGGNTPIPDDLDLLKPAPPEDDDNQPGDADEEQAENSEEETDEGWGDSPLSAKEASESDHRSEQAPSRAVSDSITITDFGGQATPPTAPPLGKRFDPDKHLAVEMDPSTLAWVLGAKQRILIEAVVGPSDEWGWRSVKAENVGRAYPPAEPGSSSEIDDEDA